MKKNVIKILILFIFIMFLIKLETFAEVLTPETLENGGKRYITAGDERYYMEYYINTELEVEEVTHTQIGNRHEFEVELATGTFGSRLNNSITCFQGFVSKEFKHQDYKNKKITCNGTTIEVEDREETNGGVWLYKSYFWSQTTEFVKIDFKFDLMSRECQAPKETNVTLRRISDGAEKIINVKFRNFPGEWTFFAEDKAAEWSALCNPTTDLDLTLAANGESWDDVTMERILKEFIINNDVPYSGVKYTEEDIEFTSLGTFQQDDYERFQTKTVEVKITEEDGSERNARFRVYWINGYCDKCREEGIIHDGNFVGAGYYSGRSSEDGPSGGNGNGGNGNGGNGNGGSNGGSNSSQTGNYANRYASTEDPQGTNRAQVQFNDVTTDWNYYRPGDMESSEAEEKIEKVLGVILNIGMMLAAIMPAIIGIKYMLGSVEEKAEYKKDLIPYLVGSILLFGICSFVKIVMLLGDTINNL